MPVALLLNVATGLVVTVTTALVAAPGWPYWVVGAVDAGVLALGTWIGTGPVSSWRLDPRTYAVGAAVALVVGIGAWWLAGADNGSFLSVGVVAGIATSIGSRPATGQRRR